jgi:hypothetical protein
LVEAGGWRVAGGRVDLPPAGGAVRRRARDADRDGIPDAIDLLIGAKKVALDGAPYVHTAPGLAYPGGDVPRTEGVCADVVVRALRNAGIDLQREIHEDAGRAPWAYPRIGRRRNPSIDHRRVKNQIRWFERHWRRVGGREAIAPGDVVFFDAMPGVADPDHVGIASDRRNAAGLPLVINSWAPGYRAEEMDLLPGVPVVAAFRAPGA